MRVGSIEKAIKICGRELNSQVCVYPQLPFHGWQRGYRSAIVVSVSIFSSCMMEPTMPKSPGNQEPPKFENPNYSNARGKEASIANKEKSDHGNPDLNAGHVQESSRPELESKLGGWNAKVDRPLVVKPIENEDGEGPALEPHGIRRV